MATTTGQDKKALITGITFLDTREINKNIIDVANDTGFDDLMMLMDTYTPTEQPNYHHFVNEDISQVLTFTAVSGSGTATLTVTISGTGYARRDLVVKFVSNTKSGKINSAVTTSSSQDSFTITSVDGTNLTASVGDKVTTMGVVMGEGSDEVTPLVFGLTKYFNFVQHFKDKTEITDIQESSKITVGTGAEAYRQAVNQATAFKLEMSSAFIGGTKSVNEYGTASPTLTDQYGNSMQTTGGVYGEVAAYGVTAAVATPGTVLQSDYDTLSDQLNAIKAPTNFVELCPDGAKRKIDGLWKNMGSSDVTSVRLNFDNKEIDFNVDKVTYGKYTHNYGPMPLLDHPQKYGAGSIIGKSIIGFPTQKVKVQVGPGGKGGDQNRVGIRYMPNPYASKGNMQGTKYVREWYTGAQNDAPTSGKEVKTCHISATQGVEVLGARQLFIQRVSA